MRRLVSRALVLLSVCSLMTAACGCSDEPTTQITAAAQVVGLYPVSVDGKWGYIDKTGAIRIRPQFDYADAFSDGLAIVGVVMDGVEKIGYIDSSGTLVIQPQFEEAGPFSDGMAAVGTGPADGHPRYGYIDKSGAIVIPIQYEYRGTGIARYAPRFSNGLCVVQVDVDGSPPSVTSTSLIGDSRARACGYIDKKGSMVIAAEFGTVWDFSEGLAGVTREDTSGFIDADGNWVIKLRSDLTLWRIPLSADPRTVSLSFSEGLALVGKPLFIDPEAPPPAEDTHFFFHFGYVNKHGKVVIEPQFVDAASFSEGLAAACIDENGIKRWGYIDRSGDWVIEPQFDYAGSFSEGLATVAVSESHNFNNPANVVCSVIDQTGRVVIALQPGRFPYAFSGGVSRVNVHGDGTTGPMTAYMDTSGKVIWQGE